MSNLQLPQQPQEVLQQEGAQLQCSPNAKAVAQDVSKPSGGPNVCDKAEKFLFCEVLGLPRVCFVCEKCKRARDGVIDRNVVLEGSNGTKRRVPLSGKYHGGTYFFCRLRPRDTKTG
jgi:hypothetical protein